MSDSLAPTNDEDNIPWFHLFRLYVRHVPPKDSVNNRIVNELVSVPKLQILMYLAICRDSELRTIETGIWRLAATNIWTTNYTHGNIQRILSYLIG